MKPPTSCEPFVLQHYLRYKSMTGVIGESVQNNNGNKQIVTVDKEILAFVNTRLICNSSVVIDVFRTGQTICSIYLFIQYTNSVSLII